MHRLQIGEARVETVAERARPLRVSWVWRADAFSNAFLAFVFAATSGRTGPAPGRRPAGAVGVRRAGRRGDATGASTRRRAAAAATRRRVRAHRASPSSSPR